MANDETAMMGIEMMELPQGETAAAVFGDCPFVIIRMPASPSCPSSESMGATIQVVTGGQIPTADEDPDREVLRGLLTVVEHALTPHDQHSDDCPMTVITLDVGNVFD